MTQIDPHRAVCRDCDWVEEMPTRENAAHAKRVHEEWMGHDVVLEPIEE